MDLNGNPALKVWFHSPTSSVQIRTLAQVITHGSNPYNFLLHPWATRIPIDYPTSLLSQLQPFLQPGLPTGTDPVLGQLVYPILDRVAGDTVSFLTELNQHIHQSCRYLIRESGDPWSAALTWSQKAGSCRDLAVLLMECCRAVGLAARFVSGYTAQADDTGSHHLHAWTEVYLPGAGWRGYDPTQGWAVADQHVALAASPLPRYVAPIVGSFTPGHVQASLDYRLQIQVQSS